MFSATYGDRASPMRRCGPPAPADAGVPVRADVASVVVPGSAGVLLRRRAGDGAPTLATSGMLHAADAPSLRRASRFSSDRDRHVHLAVTAGGAVGTTGTAAAGSASRPAEAATPPLNAATVMPRGG